MINSIKPEPLSEAPLLLQPLSELVSLDKKSLTVEGMDFLKFSKVRLYNVTRISKELQSDEVKSSEEWMAIFCRCVDLESETKALSVLKRIDDLPTLEYAQNHYIDVNSLPIDLKKKWKTLMRALKISANGHLFDGVVCESLDYVKNAIKSGANVNVTNGDTSAFSYAVYSGNKSIVSCFIEGGVDVNQRNKDNTTALHSCFEINAVRRQFNYEIFELLLSLAPNEAQLFAYKKQIDEQSTIMADPKVQEIWGSFEEKIKLEKILSLDQTTKTINTLNKSSHKI